MHAAQDISFEFHLVLADVAESRRHLATINRTNELANAI